MGPPFNKTYVAACLYLEYQRVCFIQTTRHGDRQSHAAWVLRGGRETPEPQRSLHEGRCPGEAFAHSWDCRVQGPRVQGPGRDWPQASTKCPDATWRSGIQRFLTSPPPPPVLCPLLWKVERPATPLGLAGTPLSLESRHHHWVGERTATFFEYLLRAEPVQVFRTFSRKLHFKMLKLRASENLSHVAELNRIKLRAEKGKDVPGSAIITV